MGSCAEVIRERIKMCRAPRRPRRLSPTLTLFHAFPSARAYLGLLLYVKGLLTTRVPFAKRRGALCAFFSGFTYRITGFFYGSVIGGLLMFFCMKFVESEREKLALDEQAVESRAYAPATLAVGVKRVKRARPHHSSACPKAPP